VTAYLDASALAKLVITEEETGALQRFLQRAPGPHVTSALARTEVVRGVGLRRKEAIGEARSLLDGIDTLAVTRSIVDAAGHVASELGLRSLDAIHVASALELGEVLDVVVTYDRRMAEGARALGLQVASPD
jgi:predicted nucleic acid-binding protein